MGKTSPDQLIRENNAQHKGVRPGVHNSWYAFCIYPWNGWYRCGPDSFHEVGCLMFGERTSEHLSRNVILTKFSSLAAPEFVKMSTSQWWRNFRYGLLRKLSKRQRLCVDDTLPGHFCHWLNRMLPFWQLPVEPVVEIRQHYIVSVEVFTLIVSSADVNIRRIYRLIAAFCTVQNNGQIWTPGSRFNMKTVFPGTRGSPL